MLLVCIIKKEKPESKRKEKRSKNNIYIKTSGSYFSHLYASVFITIYPAKIGRPWKIKAAIEYLIALNICGLYVHLCVPFLILNCTLESKSKTANALSQYLILVPSD